MIILLILLLTLTLNSPSIALEYKVEEEIITEWVTVSRTIPVNTCPTCLVMVYDTCNQVGTQYKVTFALIEWRGTIKRFEMERVSVLEDKKLERSIVCRQSMIMY